MCLIRFRKHHHSQCVFQDGVKWFLTESVLTLTANYRFSQPNILSTGGALNTPHIIVNERRTKSTMTRAQASLVFQCYLTLFSPCGRYMETFSIVLHFKHFYYIYLLYMCVPWCPWVSQRTTCKSQFSSSPIKIMSIGGWLSYITSPHSTLYLIYMLGILS